MSNKIDKILAEISAGELFDKITILEIKKAKISKKEKLIEINKELSSLNESVKKFIPDQSSISKYINDLKNLDVVKKQILTERLVNKQKRISIKGNSWQNLYPKEILTYKDWWQKFLAA